MPGNHGEILVDKNDNNKTRKKKKKKDDNDVKQVGIGDDFENENQLVMPPIPKTRKRFIDKFRKKPKSPNPSSSSSRSGSRKGGCFSVMRPRRTEEEASPSSPPSDPNDESFTYEMLRVMLETSDFFSNECNPHR